MLHKIIRAITILIAVALVGYIAFLKMPGASASSKEVVAELTAAELYQAYETNENKANNLYLGKAVVISGTIDDKYEDETGAPVLLIGPSGEDPVALITLEANQKSKLASYEIGTDIKVKGLCSGMLMEVALTKGIIED